MESGGTVPYHDKTGWLGRALEGQGREKPLDFFAYAASSSWFYGFR